MTAASLIVLFEDRHVIVVSKPARLLTASDKTGDETLLEQVRARNAARQADGKKGYLVPLHFLDRPVSGVVMFAASSKAASRLNEQFRTHRIDKIYRAVVEGEPAAPSGVLDDWLLKDRDDNVVAAVAPGTPGAKASQLSYKHLGAHGGRTLLELRPRTGRSHQIRVQLASRGMPIYGDRKYGAVGVQSGGTFERSVERSFEGMIALHAYQVRFEHPVTKEPLTVTAPLPAVWSAIWPKNLWDLPPS